MANHWDGSWRRFTWENQAAFPLGLTWDRDHFPAGLQYSVAIEIDGANVWASVRKGTWLRNQLKTLYYVEIQRIESGQVYRLYLQFPYNRLFDAMKATEREIAKWLYAKKGK